MIGPSLKIENGVSSCGGRLVTPPLDGRILGGTARAATLELAAELGIATEERALAVTQLRDADEVFLVAAGLLVNHSAGLPLAVAIVGIGAAGFGLFVLAGATPAALGLLADISERFPSDRGAIMGLYSVFLAVGQIIGALIGGVAADLRGIDGMLLATAGLLVVALLPLSRLRDQEHQLDGGGLGTPAT